jgi:hypothetical protein
MIIKTAFHLYVNDNLTRRVTGVMAALLTELMTFFPEVFRRRRGEKNCSGPGVDDDLGELLPIIFWTSSYIRIGY